MLKTVFLTLFSIISLNACTTDQTATFGIQPEHVAYIPARIAVWPCQSWPVQARYENQWVSNVKKDEIAKICQEVDAYVIKGFKDQPYMRGMSPKVVQALLSKAGTPEMLNEFPKLWNQQASGCDDCSDAVSYYKNSVAERLEWQQWLDTFGKKSFKSDASLLPLLTYAKQGRLDDRGVARTYYRVGLVLFLIDNSNGRLIWAGGRDAYSQNQDVLSKDKIAGLSIPPWEDVRSRLLVKDVWREFPGRQNY